MRKWVGILSFAVCLLVVRTASPAGVPTFIPNDSLVLGKSAAANKTFTFNIGGSNPAIRWNNSLSQLEFSNDGVTFSALGSGGGGGSVTSVGLSLPNIFTVSGSPVTSTGTLTATLASQSQNACFMSPDGSSGTPSFRALVGADLPLPTNTTLGGVRSIGATSHEWINQINNSGVPSTSQPDFTDISGSVAASQMPALTGDVTSSAGTVSTTVASVGGSSAADVDTATALVNGSQSGNKVLASPANGSSGAPAFRALVGADLPTPTGSTLGGVKSNSGAANSWLTSLDTGGNLAYSQPDFNNISGNLSTLQLPIGQTWPTSGTVQAITPNQYGVLISGSGATTTVLAPDASTSKVLVSGGASANPAWSLLTNSNLSGSAAISNANLATMASHTFKGNDSVSVGTPKDLSASQATAILNAFAGDSGSGGTKGLVPAPASGDGAAGKVLKADGTWGSAGTTSPLTTKGDLYAYSSANARLPIGSDGQRLIADSNQTLGLRYQDQDFKNYILNKDAEVGTEGWSTYADAAQNTPVDGTGGSPSSTWTRTTSSPLMGNGSFLWTRSANNRQGEGVSYPFSIDSYLQGRSVAVSFAYKIVSGTFFAADGITAPLNDGTTSQNAGMSDLEVFMRDETNGVLIPVSPQVLTCTSATSCSFSGTFQTSINSTSYKLILHTARSTAVAFTAQFDNFYVGPQSVSYGAPITDGATISLTLSSGFGTTSNSSTFGRRVGDSLEVWGSFQSGTVSAATAYIQIPYSINYSKLPTTGTSDVGKWQSVITGAANILDNSAGAILWGPAFTDGSTANQIFLTVGTGSSVYTKKNSNDIFPNNAYVSFRFTVPIAGWSSNVQMSNDTDTRVVSSLVYSTSQSISNSSTTKITTFTVETDRTGMWDNTNQRFVANVSGTYDVGATIDWGGNANGTRYLYVYKNGSIYKEIGRSFGTYSGSGDGARTSGSTIINLVSGDYVELYVHQNSGGALNVSPGGQVYNSFYLSKRSGTSAIAATDGIAARYYLASNTVVNNTTIPFDIKVKDSTNSYSGGVYTVQSPGTYMISTTVQSTSSAQTSVFVDRNNGTNIGYVCQTHSTTNVICSGMIVYPLLAGDTIRIKNDNNVTYVGGVQTAFNIARIGN